MPIYFNLASHFWVVGLFIANGSLLTWLLRYKFESFKAITEPFESQVISAFFISISINGLILLWLDWLELEFSFSTWPLCAIGMALLVTVLLRFNRLRTGGAFRFDLSIGRLILYGLVFIVLFYNGAMIEVISDAWWHMSLANKISLESSYAPGLGHLTGLPTRYYPPLWHGNLALANQLSGISIPVFWNSLTAWVGVFKVMGFYLFAFGLSNDRRLALVSAILFVLLPGLGVSYLRVSAWPSHVAYTAWFAMFYVCALLFDDLPERQASLGRGFLSFLSAAASKLFAFLILSILVFFTHQAELLWFAIAWLGYLIAASLSRALSAKTMYIVERDHFLLVACYRISLILFIGYSLWFAINHFYSTELLNDQKLAYLLPCALALILFVIDIPIKSRIVSLGLVFVFFVIILGSVNHLHFYSLFVPEFAMPKGRFYESSAVAIGYFGGELKVPGWHLQLRDGLLISGALSIPLSLAALVLKQNKLTVLLAGASSMATILCISPYLYQWSQDILNYHSPWRVALIIFHPILWGYVLVALNDSRKTLVELKS